MEADINPSLSIFYSKVKHRTSVIAQCQIILLGRPLRGYVHNILWQLALTADVLHHSTQGDGCHSLFKDSDGKPTSWILTASLSSDIKLWFGASVRHQTRTKHQ